MKRLSSGLILLFFFLTAACTPKLDNLAQCPFANKNTDWDSARKDAHRFIAHGGGEIDGHRYTDSGDALKNSISRGYRLVEFDLQKIDKDNEIVAAHDWDYWREVTGFKGKEVSLVDYKTAKIHQKYSGITLKEASAIFEAHKDMYLITDKIKDYVLLKKTFYSADRMLVEIFSNDDFYAAVKSGIRYPMMSLGSDEAMDFVVKNKIRMVTVHTDDIPKYQAHLNDIIKNNGCVFAYSSNESAFIKNAIANQLITGVYADSWNLQKGECDSKGPCNTY